MTAERTAMASAINAEEKKRREKLMFGMRRDEEPLKGSVFIDAW